MKTLNKIFIFFLLVTTVSCGDDFLEKYPLNSPSDVNYLSTEAEMNAALNAAYVGLDNSLGSYSCSTWNGFDFGTDIGILRPSGTYPFPWSYSAQNAETGKITSLWKHLYKYINRANYVLQNMPRGKENVSEETYNQIRAQALFLRAFYYSYLCELWGDVPWIDQIPEAYKEYYDYNRTSKEVIVDNILKDLDFAIDHLPPSWTAENYGRISSAAAGALKARIALFNKKYDVTIEAAEGVMSLGINFYSDYQKLFEFEGITAPENLLIVQYLDKVSTNDYAQSKAGRNLGGYAVTQPTRYLVDSYECTDGQSIDVSPLYNPDDPYENRDPRLKATVITDGSWFGGWKFNFYKTTTERIVDGEITTVKSNKDYSFKNVESKTGFLIRKNFDEKDYYNNQLGTSALPAVILRYSEVLLTYAEAKLENGEFDQDVCDATINAIRNRVGMPPKTNVNAMTVEQKTNIIRNERKVELAFEGLRYFDIRRWKTIEHVMNNDYVIGKYASAYVKKIQKGEPTNFPRPTFDEYGISHYPNEEEIFDAIETKFEFNPDKDYLWPIPQEEIDKDSNLLPNNPGY